ncbi:YcjX family protein [Alteromonas sp. 1_MG-2023]|uniref:YcjX family protein n=1 Tax=Alteromonas sp. 1_MG-2023 TaxID=3062669 RepID=UPI0026E24025|nr:YcjX family protein [Alteromonas sp. 1_MG-2023]MDO6475421.1 YcjX family protein [Alteromonas sp. 1_MG-2023]
MKSFLKNVLSPLEPLLDGMTSAGDWFTRENHRFTITGLSRSGKSMLFTSLMTILKYRSEHQYQCLPLLKHLPAELVDSMWLEPVDDFPLFPIDDHIASLEKGEWPAPTENVYAFKMVVRLKQTGQFKKYLFPHTHVVFEFIDYPGEWITDLPMAGKTFAQWSDSALAQQMTDPQRFYAKDWHHTLEQFDFDSDPTPEAMLTLTSSYRDYLKQAKKAGIAMLQPGSFLLDGSGFNWRETGFTPLPAKISSDITHPWTKSFNARFSEFQQDWLKPLRAGTFREADKQIILVDLFEGLNHSKQHLAQLKETLSHLADVFVYGEQDWFSKHVLRKQEIGKVAFVATKSDLIPDAEKPQLLALLKDVCGGATAKLEREDVPYEHFLVSAIQATDEGSRPGALRYTNKHKQYVEVQFEPLPARIKGMSADEHYPALYPPVPADYLPRMLNGRGLDKLFQFLLTTR